MKINGKYQINLPADRTEQYLTGWEVERLDSMYKHLVKGDVMYYIGAEQGDMPALCQIWGCEVAMFEPSDLFWNNIKRIWKMNNLQAPLFFWSGFASNEVSRLNDVTKWNEINNAIVKKEDMGFRELSKEAPNFPQITIDAVSNMIKPPTAISIDVEGAEFEVLKGAEKTLKQYKPKIWLSLHPEFLFDQWGMYASEVRNYIKVLGYKETLLAYEHEVHLYYEAI